MASPTCIACPDTSPADCSCSPSQTCVRINKSCSQCAINICQDVAPSTSQGSSLSPATTAGEAAGGALAGLIFVAIVLYFWRKRARRKALRANNLVASPTRFAKAKLPGLFRKGHNVNNEKADYIPGEDTDQRAVRTSTSLDLNTLSRRVPNNSPNLLNGGFDTGDLISVTIASSDQGHEDPFADRNSVATETTDVPRAVSQHSDFSFRSSHSTTNVPIAYIPAHSASLSLSDGHSRPPSTLSPLTANQSLATMEVIDSAAVKAAARKSANTLSAPVANSHRSSHRPSKRKSNAPARPARDPKLDLKLPELKRSSEPSSNYSSTDSSNFSSPTSLAFTNSQGHTSSTVPSTYQADGRDSLLPGSPSKTRASYFSALDAPPVPARQSAISVASSYQSDGSHMSYILDPPQIVTPASADRAVFVQASQARTVQFTKTPKTPEGQDIPIPTIPEQYKDQVESPFVDQPRSATVSTPTFGVDTERGPSPSQASEIRSSVSGSIFSSSGLSTTDLNHSSDSQFSSRSGSMLEGIPFFGQPPTPSSPLFPMPPSHKGSVPTQANSTVGVNVQPASDGTRTPTSPNSITNPFRDSAASDATSLLPTSRTTSAALSTRSGYASVLEGIPFNLGFPGGIRGSGEMFRDDQSETGSARTSAAIRNSAPLIATARTSSAPLVSARSSAAPLPSVRSSAANLMSARSSVADLTSARSSAFRSGVSLSELATAVKVMVPSQSIVPSPLRDSTASTSTELANAAHLAEAFMSNPE